MTRSLFDLPDVLLRAPTRNTLRSIEFSVHGIPATQGSSKTIPHRFTGAPTYRPDNPRLAPWRSDVAQTALVRMAELGIGGVLIDGPVRMVLRFRMPRRKKHGTRNRLEDAAVKPDLSKILRAVEDALTGVVYTDDSRITTSVQLKRVAKPGSPPGVDIAVGPDYDDSLD